MALLPGSLFFGCFPQGIPTLYDLGQRILGCDKDVKSAFRCFQLAGRLPTLASRPVYRTYLPLQYLAEYILRPLTEPCYS